MASLEVLHAQDPERGTLTLPLAAGDTLLDRLLEHGVELAHECGGNLACASCRVVVREGLEELSATSEDEQDILARAGADAPGARLACQAVAGSGDVVIEIPYLETLPPAAPAQGNAPALTLTQRAVKHFALQLARHDGAVAVRLGVRPAGCSGYRYRLEYADAIGADDVVLVSGGIRVAVERASLPFVQGTTLDFVKEGLAQRLRFDNPNARESCGCGESFSA
jgi:iron-sulfur cluster assembly protein